jgi:hypothetical protein
MIIFIFEDNGHTHTPTHFAFWWPTATYWLPLASLRYAKFIGGSYTLVFATLYDKIFSGY